jgi:uncharacterized protein (TIGR03435 family)
VPAAVDPQAFRITTPLAGAILWAYDIHNYQLSGGAQWIRRDYYRIEGRSQAPSTKKEMRAMLQNLLADRFKLKLHREAREMPIYALLVGKSGRRLPVAKTRCGEDGCIDVAPGAFIARYATISSTAATLSNMVDRPVLDETGLDGRYDFRLKFDPGFQKRYDGQVTGNTPTDDPDIFAAIQDLGLKLEPRRAAVEIFVIDEAARAGAN